MYNDDVEMASQARGKICIVEFGVNCPFKYSILYLRSIITDCLKDFIVTSGMLSSCISPIFSHFNDDLRVSYTKQNDDNHPVLIFNTWYFLMLKN